jgi:hypothetical protein
MTGLFLILGLIGQVHVGHGTDEGLSFVRGFDGRAQPIDPDLVVGDADAVGIEDIRLQSRTFMDFIFQLGPFFQRQ